MTREEFTERIGRLTERQYVWLYLAVRAIPTAGIASHMQISTKTVDTFRLEALGKLGMSIIAVVHWGTAHAHPLMADWTEGIPGEYGPRAERRIEQDHAETYLPSEDVIRDETAAIRTEWDSDEMDRRRRGRSDYSIESLRATIERRQERLRRRQATRN